jgi:hypothetical protein
LCHSQGTSSDAGPPVGIGAAGGGGGGGGGRVDMTAVTVPANR